MANNIYKRVMLEKQNRKYISTYETTDKTEVLEWLVADLSAKYLHKSNYVKRVQDKTNYNGTRTITIYYNNNCKSVYTVKN